MESLENGIGGAMEWEIVGLELVWRSRVDMVLK